MRKFIYLLSMIALGLMLMSVNSKDAGAYREYATIDADPTASGYFTNEINTRSIRKTSKDKVYFSVRGTFVGTVSLQFKAPGDATWTTYEDYTAVTRQIVDDNGAGVKWRAGITASANYTSGSVTFGFDW